VFAAFVAIFLVYAALFIYRTSFVVGGERYFSLFDDAMVSMRYARNFAHGYGLVWNPGGERVEGYTNPLWVLYMSLVHLLPLRPSKTSLIVQVTAAIFLALNLIHVRRLALALSRESDAVALAAVALTATYLPINNWSLQGMEVSALVLLTTACLSMVVRNYETGVFSPAVYLLLGLGTLVRADMAVAYAAVLSFLVVADPIHRRKHVVWGVAVLACAVATQTLFSLWYYGELLPNTFYLKVTGIPFLFRIARGVYVLLQFIWKANALLFLLTALLLLRRDPRVWLLFWVFIAQAAYSVYVGGDAWEYWGGSNRYLCIVMPAFFVLLSCALGEVTRALANAFAASRLSGWMFAASVAFAIVSLNSIHGVRALAEALLIRPALHSGYGEENEQDVEQALLLRGATTPEATVAVVRAGTIPYFADRTSIDLLGKNDRRVAREPARLPDGPRRFVDWRPGHTKFDFAYSIGQLQPDVIVALRNRTNEAMPFLDGYRGIFLAGSCAYVRRSSRAVVWNRLPSRGCAE
jgi:hypothetical protein